MTKVGCARTTLNPRQPYILSKMEIKTPIRSIRLNPNVVPLVSFALVFGSLVGVLMFGIKPAILLWEAGALYAGCLATYSFGEGRNLPSRSRRIAPGVTFILLLASSFMVFEYWRPISLILILTIPFILILGWLAEIRMKKALRALRDNPPSGGGFAESLVPAGPRPPRRFGANAKEWPQG